MSDGDAINRPAAPGPVDGTPAEVYAERLDRHLQERTRLERSDRNLSNLRLASFGIAAVTGWFAFGQHSISGGWVLPPALAFVALLVAHDRTIQSRKRAARRVDYYEAGIARLEDRWMGQGNAGDEFDEPGHPYAHDLDLFGEGSLFERVCTARTPVGQETLATWLKTQASAEVARARQAAVVELTPRLELREDVALLGEDLKTQFNSKAMIAWANAPSVFEAKKSLNWIAAAASGLSVAGLVAWLAAGLGPLPFLFALIPQTIFGALMRKRVSPILATVEKPTRDLALLRDLLSRLENETVSSPLLVSLRERLQTEGLSCAKRIAELRSLTDLLDARRNQFFAPVALLFLWSTQLGLAIERWRIQWGGVLEDWLLAAGEFEALVSLSGYAYENPGSIFPEVCDGEPELIARGMGHPLLPDEQCVRNDLELGAGRRALIISGSNMSGKSTYLRTAGCNILLALTGAPVRAESL
ncbi:MAG: DNA mismatch repair protein MutS, partial [Deltaproteobacteria bacterium]|nr:DNA mismatch repair protein MutS [Deltaproteobacteria bacterium]